MLYIFKKHFIDDVGTYKIGYYTYNANTDSYEFQKYVNENKPLYTNWLAEPNTPDEVAYSAPTYTLDEKRTTVKSLIMRKQDMAYNAGFTFETNIYPSGLPYREKMLAAARLAQKAIDASETLSKDVFTIDNTVVSLSETQLIALLEAYDAYGSGVYDTFMTEMQTAETAIESELDYYIENNTFV